MILTLHTEGWFDAAHHLDNYDGACKNLHGHTYKVEVWVRGSSDEVSSNGILWDFGNLKELIAQLDHPVTGDLTTMFKYNATAEFLCQYIFKQIKQKHNYLLFKVRVYEQIQPKESWCECGDWQ